MSNLAAPIAIEDEPPHEFYSRLCGLRSALSSQLTSTDCGDYIPAFPRPAEDSAKPRNNVGTLIPISSEDSFPSVSKRNKNVSEQQEEDIFFNPSSIMNNAKSAFSIDSEATAQTQFSQIFRMATQNPPQLTSFALNAKNCKGYTMLRNMGWREECNRGRLGKNHQGLLEPLPVTLKLDRYGLGRHTKQRRSNKVENCKRMRIREHILLQDEKSSAQGNSQIRSDRQQQQQQKHAYLMLRTDVSTKYEELYWELHKRQPSRALRKRAIF